MADIKQDGYKSSDVIAAIGAVFDSNETAREQQIKKVNGIFELRIKNDEDKEAVWTIDLKKAGKVTKGPSSTKPDVVISASDSNFVDIATGKLSGQKAFMTGKLKAKGNIMLAMKLDGVLKTAKTQAKL